MATLPESKIIDLVELKSNWIRNKISHFQEIQGNQKEKEYVSGESFTYLGRNYRLKVLSSDAGNGVKLMNGKFNVHVPKDVADKNRNLVIVEQLEEWYVSHAIVRFKDLKLGDELLRRNQSTEH